VFLSHPSKCAKDGAPGQKQVLRCAQNDTFKSKPLGVGHWPSGTGARTPPRQPARRRRSENIRRGTWGTQGVKSELSAYIIIEPTHHRAQTSLSLHVWNIAQRPLQVFPKVIECFDTDAKPQQRRREMLLPRNAGSTFNSGLDGAQAGGVLDEL
jgi:hypothetical protein